MFLVFLLLCCAYSLFGISIHHFILFFASHGDALSIAKRNEFLARAERIIQIPQNFLVAFARVKILFVILFDVCFTVLMEWREIADKNDDQRDFSVEEFFKKLR